MHTKTIKSNGEKFSVYVEKFGYQLLSDYIGSAIKVKLKCCKNHIYEATPSNFKTGKRCGICRGQKFENPDHFEKYVEKFGYQLLSNYADNRTKVKLKCCKNHIYEATPNSFKTGKRCSICHFSNHYSGRTVISVTARIQTAINTQLKRDGLNKTWQDFYTDDQLKETAEPITDFYLRSPRGHHVDHIIPVSLFDLTDPIQLKTCWSLPNLQYLPASKNISKGDRLHEIQLMEIAENEELYNIFQVASRSTWFQKWFVNHCRTTPKNSYRRELSDTAKR